MRDPHAAERDMVACAEGVVGQLGHVGVLLLQGEQLGPAVRSSFETSDPLDTAPLLYQSF